MTEAEWLASDDPATMLRFVTENPDHDNIDCVRSDRKLRLSACACCRAVWDGGPCGRCKGEGSVPGNPTMANYTVECVSCHGTGRTGGLTDPRSRAAVEVAEHYADGLATKKELTAARLAAYDALRPLTGEGSWAADAATMACNDDADYAAGYMSMNPPVPPPAAQAALLRDIVGNPFRPVSSFCDNEYCRMGRMNYGGHGPCPKCQSVLIPTVAALAQRIYDDRDFALLPVLADALEDAGCTDKDIMWHLRDIGPWYGQQWIRHKPTHVRGCWALDLLLGKE